MAQPRTLVQWTGNVSWTVGQQSTTKWLTAGSWITKDYLGNLVVATSAPTLDSQGMVANLMGKAYERCTFFMYAKKTAHADSVSFSLRLVHAWGGATPEMIQPITLRPGGGHTVPYMHQPATAFSSGQQVWDTNQGGIKDAMALNAYNFGSMAMVMDINGNVPLNIGCVRVAVELVTGAAALTGTNTWATTCGFILC